MTPTPEQIQAMQAGPAMNAAVAAGLGCTVAHTGGPRSCAFCACPDRAHGEPHSSEGAWAIKPYSTSIAAAFELQAEIARRDLWKLYIRSLVLLVTDAQHLERIWYADEADWWAVANASPLDRCKAALIVLARRHDAARGEG